MSLRAGEVLRDVLGLVPADGDDVGSRLFECCLRKGGACVVDVVDGFCDSL